ncbi:terminase large subunit domain-containing protein [Symmachiella dynata]|uniref:terminase large subunit domain-containing protein n=1 Tax=Symmachiella dynata TaxID=2527995 RepID=UPI0011A03927|nr:terminase large subunit [Symmachiella dynata]
MQNCLSWQQRRDLRYRLRLHGALKRRAAKYSPADFRRQLRLRPGSPVCLGDATEAWQAADFAALDGAWLSLAGRGGAVGVRRAYIERPRGHGKTSDMAAQVLWILLYAESAVNGLVAAADLDQATLLRKAIERFVRLNQELCGPLRFRQHGVVNGKTGSRLEVISSDVQSSWGALPDFVVCDELSHWPRPDMWHSLFSSAAKKRDCVLAILTNAGVGRGWQWDVREAARTSSSWYFSSIAGPCAPWIRDEDLQEQRELLPPSVYDRLWRNIWQEGGGEFVTLAEAEACRDADLSERSRSAPGCRYIAAIDYAEKRDYTVGVVVHREGQRVVVDRMDVVRPQPDAPVEVAWVEEWIERIAADFHAVTFVVDEYQLVSTIQKFGRRFDVRRFEFLSGRGNHALALNLRQLILQRLVRWYAGCGELHAEWGRDDLETELASVVLRQSASGRCRIDHHVGGRQHDDRAFALGAACLHAVEGASGGEWLLVGSM